MALAPERPQTAAPGAAPKLAPAIIEFSGVVKQYDSGDFGLRDASFTIRRGEFVFLVGASGSGKSTIMKLLLKEHEPTTGTIRVAGKDIGALKAGRVPHYRRNIGAVFQDFKLLPSRTVHDNVAYALQVTGGSRKDVRG